MRRIRSHLSYANVMATLAVFLVLGGGTAVALGGKNTVQSDDLGPGAQVKAPDVADNAVDSQAIANASIAYDDLSRGATGGRAWGRIAANGYLSRSKNVTGVINPQVGLYCITVADNISPASAALIVAPDFSGSHTYARDADVTVVQWDSGANCGSQSLAVRTFLYDGDVNDNDSGGTSLGDSLSTSNEPFTFVVP